MRLDIYGANSLNFVEFNTTGDNIAYVRCDKDSSFMDTELFNIFSECFEKSNNLYDYFGPTKFNSRNIVILLNGLKEFKHKIEQMTSLDEFLDFTGSKFLGSNLVIEIEKTDKSWRLNWELYSKKLLDVNNQLIELVSDCIEKEKILWLIGY
jgi:hypothetical protein